MATASDAPSLPTGVEADEELTLQVVVPAKSLELGEPLRVTAAMRNTGSDEVEIGGFRTTETFYAFEPGLGLRPLVVRTLHYDTEGVVVVEPGSRWLVRANSSVWSGRLAAGGTAGPGAYVYALQVESGAVNASSFDVFGIGPVADGVLWDAELATGALKTGSGDGSATTPAGYLFDSRPETLPRTWRYNPNGAPGSVSGSAATMINTAFETWKNDGGSAFTHSRGSDSTSRAFWTDDGTNLIGWCTSSADCRSHDLSSTTIALSGCWADPVAQVSWDCGLVFNATRTWSSDGSSGFGFQAAATHEVGHWMALQDLYNTVDGAQTMYGYMSTGTSSSFVNSLHWGDEAGVRYAMPERKTMTNTIEDSVQDADSALRDVDGNGVRDLILGWVANPLTNSPMYYRVGWNLNADSASASGWTATKSIHTSTVATDGLGLAVGNLDSDTRFELVAVWLEDASGSNNLKYAVGWNVDASGNAQRWDVHSAGTAGWYQQGLGACLVNLDATSSPELVVAFADNPSGGNSIKYRVGKNMDSAGEIGQWTTTSTIGDTIGDQTAGLGLACVDVDGTSGMDLVFAWVDNPSGGNNIYYRVAVNVNSDGLPSTTIMRKSAPGGTATIGDLTQGLGLAQQNLDSQSYPELVFAYVDNPTGPNPFHYLTEWNGRIRSHS